MATVTSKRKESPCEYTVVLSSKEAGVLLDILYRCVCGGSNSPREYLESVTDKLVKEWESNSEGTIPHHLKEITFDSGPGPRIRFRDYEPRYIN